MKIRMAWEYYPNDSRATLHVSDPMFRFYSFIFSQEEFGKLNNRQQALIESVRSILGVKEVSVSPYEVRIQRAGVFEWEEITGKVESLVSDYCGGDVQRMPCPLTTYNH